MGRQKLVRGSMLGRLLMPGRRHSLQNPPMNLHSINAGVACIPQVVLRENSDKLEGFAKLVLQRKSSKKTCHSRSERSGWRPHVPPSASLGPALAGAAAARAQRTASLSFPSPTQDPCASAEQTPGLRERAAPLWKPEACQAWGAMGRQGNVLLLGQSAGCPHCQRLPGWGSLPVPPPLPFGAASVLAEWP